MFIGMESVEIGYLVATIGLVTVAYVKRVAAEEETEDAEEAIADPWGEHEMLPGLEAY